MKELLIISCIFAVSGCSIPDEKITIQEVAGDRVDPVITDVVEEKYSRY
jgi:hypothetical protein